MKKGLAFLVFFSNFFVASNAQWYQLGQANGIDFNNAVTSITTDTKGNVYAGGYFTSGNSRNLCFVSKWNGSGWSQLGGWGSSKFNGIINTITTDTSGKIYAGGTSTNTNGKYYVAVYGKSWGELGGTNKSTFDSTILSITTDKAGNVYACGSFKNKNRNNYVAKWNGTNWTELGGNNNSTFNDDINSITTDANGNVYAGGNFTNANGKKYLARWDGTNWSELGGINNSTFDSSILSITTDKTGNVYVGGSFTNTNGRKYIAKWNGTIWSELGGINTSTFNSTIYSIASDTSGSVYAGGDFTNANGKQYVAKWNGNSWSELGSTNTSAFNNAVLSITIDASSNVYSAGAFNYTFSYYVAEYLVTPPHIISFSPTKAATGATVTIKGSGFYGTKSISFGGIAANNFTVVDNVTITAIVGSGADGFIKAVNENGADSLAGFSICTSSVRPSISITSSVDTSICPGTTKTFTATINNGGSSPQYAWWYNGNGGYGGSTYSFPVYPGYSLYCQLTSNQACASPTTVNSNTLGDAGVFKTPLNLGANTAAAYSLRRLSNCYTGAAIKVRRSSDNSTQDISFTNLGDLDTIALKSFVGTSTAYVNTWYDQSSFGMDVTQNTNMMQPIIVKAGVIQRLGNNVAIYFDSTTLVYSTSGSYRLIDYPVELHCLAGISKNTHGSFVKIGRETGGVGLGIGNQDFNSDGNNIVALKEGAAWMPSAISFNANNLQSLGLIVPNTGSSRIFYNGIETDLNNSTIPNRPDDNLYVGGYTASDGTTRYAKYYMSEILIFASELSAKDRAKLDSNQNVYYFNGYPAPVTISSFAAIANKGSIQTNWQTATELNTNHFAVQRSTDGINFSAVGTVMAKGSGANIYSFTDSKPANGINYYRLQSVDKDGSSNYSKVVSVTFGDNQSLSIIPNPARDFATISFSKTVDKATIVVYDITGKAVIKQSLSGTNAYKLNTQTLTNGIYVIKVNTATGSYNEKLLINK